MPTTVWHITSSTYGSRLHGDERLTVDRRNNQFGTPYLAPDPDRVVQDAEKMAAGEVRFSKEQQAFIQAKIPELCVRGGWTLIECSAAGNHVHVVCGVASETHGNVARSLLKRWLTQALDGRWRMAKRPDGTSWWAEGGSARAVKTQK